MKKLLLILALAGATCGAFAQTSSGVSKSTTKTAMMPKHKKAHAKKSMHKSKAGATKRSGASSTSGSKKP